MISYHDGDLHPAVFGKVLLFPCQEIRAGADCMDAFFVFNSDLVKFVDVFEFSDHGYFIRSFCRARCWLPESCRFHLLIQRDLPARCRLPPRSVTFLYDLRDHVLSRQLPDC